MAFLGRADMGKLGSQEGHRDICFMLSKICTASVGKHSLNS